MHKYESERTEYLAVFVMLAWGVTLLSPFWDTFSNGQVFAIMQRLASEQVWGGAMFVGGLFRAIMLGRDGQLWRLRLVVVIFTMLVWFFLAAMSALASISSPAWTLYATVGGIEILSVADLLTAHHQAASKSQSSQNGR